MYGDVQNADVKRMRSSSKPFYSYIDAVSRWGLTRNNKQVKHVLPKRRNARLANCTAQSHYRTWFKFYHCFLRNNAEERSSHLTRLSPNFDLHILTSYTLIFRALLYNSEGRGFDSRWCHSNFTLTLSFRSHYGLWDRISYWQKWEPGI